MPLSEHEQRMLDQIESALYAEDPKFVSSVRGNALRAPSARRRAKGAALSLVGLGLLVAGIPFYSHNHAFILISIVGFIVMFAGAVIATTTPRSSGKDKAGHRSAGPSRPKKAKGTSSGSFTSRMEDRFRKRFDG